ncbi:MAG: hypothetical protein K6B75_08710 [Lachnospiraceae bacterium]|nr:hypothetical protein [Lachnospiraceae bacterium]
MRKYKLRIGLDVDDVLYDCNAYALSLINAKYPDEEPISINEIKGWGVYGRRADERIKYYSDPEFVANQPVLPGAQKFVHELTKFADVFFVTAVPVACMSARGQRLLKDFPEVPPQNIIIGTRKDVIQLDILLDDAAHNISNSKAAYPVLLRKPWNMDMSGILSVNSYSDFLSLCKMIRNSFTEKISDLSNGGVVCLVGPSGSLKNEIAHALTRDKAFEKPVTSTTRPKRTGEDENLYRFISEDQFLKEKDEGKFIESTVYSKYHFGTQAEAIGPILERGHYAVIPIDVCGALTISNEFRKHSLLVFVNRPKASVIRNIVERYTDPDDKVRRIMALDFEYRNVEVCDAELTVGDDPEAAAETLKELIKTKFTNVK